MRTPEECRAMAERLDREACEAHTELRRSAYHELAQQWRRLAAKYESPALFEDDDRPAGVVRSAGRNLN